MIDGNESGARDTHTVDSAASVIEGLLSDNSEDGETDETPTPGQPETEQDEVEEQPEPETEGQEDDEQAPVEDESDEAEVADDQPAQPRKVKVSDEIGEVTEDELIKGYLRQQDYTRKTQAVAEDRKKQSSDFEAVKRERAEYATKLTELRSAIEAAMPKEPDWDKLREEAPDEFANTWALWDQHKKRFDALRRQEAEARERVQRDNAEALAATLEAEREKLLSAIPEWSSAEVAKKEKQELIQHAVERGFTEEDIRGVTDHRVLLLLRDALLYAKAKKAKPSVQKKIEVAKPGTAKAPVPKQVAEITRRRQRLAKTGKAADAASIIELMLPD